MQQQQQAEQQAQQQMAEQQNQLKEEELMLKEAELDLEKYKVDQDRYKAEQDNATKITVAQINPVQYHPMPPSTELLPALFLQPLLFLLVVLRCTNPTSHSLWA